MLAKVLSLVWPGRRMNILISACWLSALWGPVTSGQDTGVASDPAAEANERFSEQELDELVGPIALYPDTLVAQILPASTYPLEIVQAARFLEDHEGEVDEETIKALTWDPSVLALMHYPEVIDLLNGDLDWTTTLGDAVTLQQTDVMDAIQRFRERAATAGNLQTNEQVIVIKEKEIITVESADPTVVYVPRYDPQVVVIRDETRTAPVVAFSTGMAAGAWLGYSCGWHHRRIDIEVDRRYYWGSVRTGWGAKGYWHSSTVGGTVRRTSRGTARRTVRRTEARAGVRTGSRTGAAARRRSDAAPRTIAERRSGGAAGVAAGQRSGAATGRRKGVATGHRSGADASRASKARAYGGYKPGNQARRDSSRGASSRGSISRSGRGGAGRRGR